MSAIAAQVQRKLQRSSMQKAMHQKRDRDRNFQLLTSDFRLPPTSW
ncbi:hypothetical protein [Nostoc flagelliforme]|nr:hypothetical protein [Nostoc flagelliforme]